MDTILQRVQSLGAHGLHGTLHQHVPFRDNILLPREHIDKQRPQRRRSLRHAHVTQKGREVMVCRPHAHARCQWHLHEEAPQGLHGARCELHASETPVQDEARPGVSKPNHQRGSRAHAPRAVGNNVLPVRVDALVPHIRHIPNDMQERGGPPMGVQPRHHDNSVQNTGHRGALTPARILPHETETPCIGSAKLDRAVHNACTAEQNLILRVDLSTTQERAHSLRALVVDECLYQRCCKCEDLPGVDIGTVDGIEGVSKIEVPRATVLKERGGILVQPHECLHVHGERHDGLPHECRRRKRLPQRATEPRGNAQVATDEARIHAGL
eukprot:1857578-Rhodomonas_salina.1